MFIYKELNAEVLQIVLFNVLQLDFLKDPYWQQVHKPLRLLEVLHNLLSHICENRTIIPSVER